MTNTPLRPHSLLPPVLSSIPEAMVPRIDTVAPFAATGHQTAHESRQPLISPGQFSLSSSRAGLIPTWHEPVAEAPPTLSLGVSHAGDTEPELSVSDGGTPKPYDESPPAYQG